MEASQIKVGDRLACTTTSHPQAYSHRVEVEVVRAITVDWTGDSKYRTGINLQQKYDVVQTFLHRGKSHYIVNAIAYDKSWIVASSHLPEPWAQYQARVNGAKQERVAAEVAKLAYNEQAEGLIENFQALGLESARWGGSSLLLSLEDAESLLGLVLEVIQ